MQVDTQPPSIDVKCVATSLVLVALDISAMPWKCVMHIPNYEFLQNVMLASQPSSIRRTLDRCVAAESGGFRLLARLNNFEGDF